MLWLLAALSLSSGSGTYRAATAEPELARLRSRTIQLARDQASYEQHADRVLEIDDDGTFLRLVGLPEAVGSDVRMGSGFGVLGVARPWAWDQDAEDQDILYLDLDADGALTDDEVWWFEVEGDDQFVQIEETFEAEEEEGGPSLVVKVEQRWTIGNVQLPGSSEPSPVLFVDENQSRRGTLNLPTGPLRFCLLGEGGLYNAYYHAVLFDLDGNGKFDLNDRNGDEYYQVKEGTVNVDDKSFAFLVDRYGRWLELEELAVRRADRADLRVGKVAPDFSVVDWDGESHRLQDYRGKIVYLDFWSLGCGPCVAELPHLVKTYEKYKDAGFEILGINLGDPEEILRRHLDKVGATWPQIYQAGFDDEVTRRYRIQALPGTYLIGADGKILSDDLRGALLDHELNRLLGPGSGQE
jgi:thiol-disulfide isomerase/thioredoxin